MDVFESTGVKVATAGVIIVTIAIFYVKYLYSYWDRRKFAYIKPKFPFGNFENPLTGKISLGFYFKSFYEEFKRRGVKHGGGIYSLLSPIYIPIHPDMVKEILTKSFQNFHERGFYSNEKDQPESATLFMVDGEKWKTLRAKFTPVFTSSKMKAMFEVMISSTKDLEKYVLDQAIQKKPLNIKETVGSFTTDIIGSAAFGVECNSFKDANSPFQKNAKYTIEYFSSFLRQTVENSLPNLSKMLGIVPFPPSAVKFFSNLVEGALKNRELHHIVRKDFLDILINLRKEMNLSLEDIKGNGLLFFIAGYETSATTMTFTLFEIASHPEIQSKVRDEIEEVLAKYNGEYTYDSVSEMKYLGMVMDEALRKYPPVPFLNRRCAQEYRVPGTNQIIEKGTNIIIPVLGFQRDPEYYPNPDLFDPERFADEGKQSIKNQYYYLPFGQGPRNCIGARYGLIQAKIGVISLIKNFKITLNPKTKTPIEFTNSFLMTPLNDILLDVEIIAK